MITNALMKSPAFMIDFEKARAELRQVLGYPAEPNAVGSVKPIDPTSEGGKLVFVAFFVVAIAISAAYQVAPFV